MSDDVLKDYEDEAKLKQWLNSENDPDNPSIPTRYYTLYSLLPDLRDKTVIDLPCGVGHKARKFILQFGAKKVIAAEIVEKQLKLSSEADFTAGIKPGQIEYVLQDAKQPKVFANPLADLCISVHLLCFAEDYTELVGMCHCIYINLKPGGVCYVLVCSLNKDDQLVKQFEDFDTKILHIDPWQGNVHKPRRFGYVYKGFNYYLCLWEYEVLCQALKEVGFSNVVLHPYQEDPSYNGRLNLVLYNSIVQGNIIVATKQ